MRMIQLRGSEDIDDRISWICYEINLGKRDPRIRQIAGEILAGSGEGKWNVAERDWQGEADAVYWYVRNNVRYTRDIQEVELFQKPKRTLETKIGDCDDLSILIGSLLQTIGYPVILRVVGLGGNTYQHIYPMAGIPPHAPTYYRALDASRGNGPGWEVTENVTLRTDYEVYSL
jgi:hypothetical protein